MYVFCWLLFQDGKPLPNKGNNGNLTLVNLGEEDRGIYQCIASNEVTSIFTETELMIENTAPRAPYSVHADTTESSIIVTWKSGLTEPKLEFSVWYRIIGSMTWKFLPYIPKDVNEVIIPDLLSGTDYEVMVLSKDLYGDGMFSKSVQAKTKGKKIFVIKLKRIDRSVTMVGRSYNKLYLRGVYIK